MYYDQKLIVQVKALEQQWPGWEQKTLVRQKEFSRSYLEDPMNRLQEFLIAIKKLNGNWDLPFTDHKAFRENLIAQDPRPKPPYIPSAVVRYVDSGILDYGTFMDWQKIVPVGYHGTSQIISIDFFDQPIKLLQEVPKNHDGEKLTNFNSLDLDLHWNAP